MLQKTTALEEKILKKLILFKEYSLMKWSKSCSIEMSLLYDLHSTPSVNTH